MIILAIESSCDETAVAISKNGREILSNVVLSQADIHAIYGGVVPEIASRKHVEAISGLVEEAIRLADINKKDIDAVAATYAPGLIGAVLVGLNFAKALAFSLGVPFIPVHHMRGHIAANYIAFPELTPPFLCLVISGGHSLIVDVRDYTDMHVLGSTRDDAAGEAFDKVARVLGLSYPGGAQIDKLSRGGDANKYQMPHPKVDGSKYDMSFSGLKTAVLSIANTAKMKNEEIDRESLAASFTKAVSNILVPRFIEASREYGRDVLAAAGGVAANSTIRDDLTKAAACENKTLYIPPLKLCGDNGAMIACQAYYEYLAGHTGDMHWDAKPSLSLDEISYN